EESPLILATVLPVMLNRALEGPQSERVDHVHTPAERVAVPTDRAVYAVEWVGSRPPPSHDLPEAVEPNSVEELAERHRPGRGLHVVGGVRTLPVGAPEPETPPLRQGVE